jgi:hypothetical protein
MASRLGITAVLVLLLILADCFVLTINARTLFSGRLMAEGTSRLMPYRYQQYLITQNTLLASVL